jgi:hypothetical protein
MESLRKMKYFSLTLGTAALVAVLAGCSGSNAGSQLPSPGAMQLTAFHRTDSTQRDTASGNPKWLMYYYCSASSEICPSHTSYYYNLVTFYLNPGRYTALLVTTDKSLTGDLTKATLTDEVNVTAGRKNIIDGFAYQGEPSCGSGGGAPPNARFFFTTGGLFQYTHYWWSNPESWTLAQQPSSSTISQMVNQPGEWSDWNGQLGSVNPTKFAKAIGKVRMVGLSFGGGCFFENGVTVTGYKRGIFNSTFTESDS